jgi:hypothetical protein
MPQVPTMGIRVALLHTVIRHIVNGFIDWLIAQEQISIRTPDQEVISQRVFIFVLSINYCERELPPNIPPLHFL